MVTRDNSLTSVEFLRNAREANYIFNNPYTGINFFVFYSKPSSNWTQVEMDAYYKLGSLVSNSQDFLRVYDALREEHLKMSAHQRLCSVISKRANSEADEKLLSSVDLVSHYAALKKQSFSPLIKLLIEMKCPNAQLDAQLEAFAKIIFPQSTYLAANLINLMSHDSGKKGKILVSCLPTIIPSDETSFLRIFDQFVLDIVSLFEETYKVIPDENQRKIQVQNFLQCLQRASEFDFNAHAITKTLPEFEVYHQHMRSVKKGSSDESIGIIIKEAAVLGHFELAQDMLAQFHPADPKVKRKIIKEIASLHAQQMISQLTIYELPHIFHLLQSLPNDSNESDEVYVDVIRMVEKTLMLAYGISTHPATNQESLIKKGNIVFTNWGYLNRISHSRSTDPSEIEISRLCATELLSFMNKIQVYYSSHPSVPRKARDFNQEMQNDRNPKFGSATKSSSVSAKNSSSDTPSLVGPSKDAMDVTRFLHLLGAKIVEARSQVGKIAIPEVKADLQLYISSIESSIKDIADRVGEGQLGLVYANVDTEFEMILGSINDYKGKSQTTDIFVNSSEDIQKLDSLMGALRSGGNVKDLLSQPDSLSILNKRFNRFLGGSLVIHLAKAPNTLENLKEVLALPADKINLSVIDYVFNNTALVWAIANANNSAAMAIIEAGKRGHYLDIQCSSRNSAMHMAVGKGYKKWSKDNQYLEVSNLQLVQAMIANGADVNLINVNGNTPLHLACLHRDPEMIAALLKAKADPSIRNNAGQSPQDLLKVSKAEANAILDHTVHAYRIDESYEKNLAAAEACFARDAVLRGTLSLALPSKGTVSP